MLAPWASRRRRELLELFDRIHLAIGELTSAVEQEVQKRPDAQRLSKGIPYGVTFSAGKEKATQRLGKASTVCAEFGCLTTERRNARLSAV